MLEELGTPYEIVKYQRMSPVPFAPPELKAVHPLGKSPVLEDKGRVIAESGAEVEYLIDTYGKGRFKPAAGTDDYWRYIEWMHYAEGSAMLPLLSGALYRHARRRGGGAEAARRQRDRQQPVLHGGQPRHQRLLRGQRPDRRRHPVDLRRGSGRGAACAYPGW
ncbi:MAG: glutathione S-transferase [Rhizomicrobium sp.]